MKIKESIKNDLDKNELELLELIIATQNPSDWETVESFLKNEIEIANLPNGYNNPEDIKSLQNYVSRFTVQNSQIEDELKHRLNTQVSNFITKADEADIDDIEEEIFGTCDHLEIILTEKGIHQDDVPFEELRDIQHEAISELRSHFDL